MCIRDRDHLFESEAARDSYFTDNLDELVTATPIIVNTGSEVVFQVWGGMTNPTRYDNSQWSAMTIPSQWTQLTDTPSTITASRIVKSNEAGNSLEFNDALTENRILAADNAGGLKDTQARFIGNDLFIPGTL